MRFDKILKITKVEAAAQKSTPVCHLLSPTGKASSYQILDNTVQVMHLEIHYTYSTTNNRLKCIHEYYRVDICSTVGTGCVMVSLISI